MRHDAVLSKCLVGSDVKNGDSIKQRNGIYTSQDLKDCKILWDFPTQNDKTLELNRPDVTVIDKKNNKCLLIDPACPFDTRIDRKEENAQVILS